MATARRIGILALAAAVVAVGAAVGFAGWAGFTTNGAAWVLARIAGLHATGLHGVLLGDLDAERIEIVLAAPAGAQRPGRLVLHNLALREPRFDLAGAAGRLRIGFASVEATRLEFIPEQPSAPAAVPASLALPLELQIDSLHVGALHTPGLGANPVTDLRARVHLGADDGRTHRVDDFGAAWRGVRLDGAAQLASGAPFDLVARLHAAPAAPSARPSAWRADAQLRGPLQAIELDAALQGEPAGGRTAPSLGARATLRPFAPWPLGALQARTDALDLAALDPAWPSTAISGTAQVLSVALDRPAEVRLDLRNAGAGRVDDGRIPLRALAIELVARPDQPSTLELRRIDAELGTAQRAAGTLGGSGAWTPAAWSIAATLAAVEPAQLHSRAPRLRIGGPVELSGDGFASARLADARVALRAVLDGRFEHRGAAREARLRIEAGADRRGVDVKRAELQSAGARASLAATLRRADGDEPWHARGEAELADFDPLPWWPGAEDSPWRRGPHRLAGRLAFDLRLADAARGRPPAQQLAALRGEASLKLAPSVLAGVALSGTAGWRSDGRAPASLALDADAEGNRLRLQGRFDAAGSGSADHWEAALAAPAIERLAPLVQLVAPGLPGASGALHADAVADGRWPALRTEGSVQADRLLSGEVAIRRAEGRWQLAPSPDAPLQLQLALTQVALGARSVESARLEVNGSAREHRIEIGAGTKALPPPWVEEAQAIASGRPAVASKRSELRVEARGSLEDVAGAARGAWRGRIGVLELRGDAGAPWLAARDVDAMLGWGATAAFELAPGRADLLGTVLRWSRVAWSAGQRPGLVVQAEIEPLAVAPLLARVQPDFGWGGDLALGARIDVRRTQVFDADIVVERRGGDLSVTDEVGTTALGLTDLRLALAAHDGVWSFTQGLAGRTLGVAAGAFVARTTPDAAWPGSATPVSGVLELQVANLGTWGTWVPPGWRLGGMLRVSAGIAGRFGAPEYTGEVRGSGLSVRNFAEGVAVHDGEVVIALEGARAHVERIAARSGEGSVLLTGEALLGATPQADLRLTAERFQLLGRVDRRIVAGGEARLRLDRDQLALDGRLRVDEGLVDFTRRDAPSLGGDVVVVGRRAAAAPAPAAAASEPVRRAGPALPPPRLDVRVDLGERLRVRGRGLDTGLRGELRLTSPGGRLALNGTVRAVDGTYAAYGQKLAIDKGELTFSGAGDNPRLDIEATRPNLDIRVGVAVVGTAIAPRVRLFSEPELPEIDKLAWLVLGRPSDGLGSAETALLQRAAVALLAGEGEGFTSQFVGAIGLDDLSLRQSDGEVRQTVVSLGKQLSRRWYVGYERGLNATVGTWQLVYRVARRFTLRAQSGLDNSLDAIWTWRWN